MATKKSNEVTNADALTGIKSNPAIAGMRLNFKKATIEVAVADNNADILRMMRVHSSWVIAQVLIANDAVQSGTSFDLGLYDTVENGAAVVDADHYASALTMVTARTAWTDVTLEATSAGADPANAEKAIWETLGLSADPNKYYDLCFLLNAAGSGAGTVSVMLYYGFPN